MGTIIKLIGALLGAAIVVAIIATLAVVGWYLWVGLIALGLAVGLVVLFVFFFQAIWMSIKPRKTPPTPRR